MGKKEKNHSTFEDKDASERSDSPGQDSGHTFRAQIPPLAFSWSHFVDQLAEEHGGLAELARHLQDIAPESANLSFDSTTIERGLRRLRSHGNAPANKYGHLLLRCFGIPSTIAMWAREMGQYHSRSSDLPVSMRYDQLRLWDRPPISESPHAAWIHIGLATLAHRENDREQLQHRLKLAHLVLQHAEPAAQIEMALFEARLSSDQKDKEGAFSKLKHAQHLLDTHSLSDVQHACYFARLQDQYAYIVARSWRTDPEALQKAKEYYESIPHKDAPAFARFRREHGRAWCLWRQKRPKEAYEAAQRACEAAGDGGYLRHRCMSLQLQAHILDFDERSSACLQRAKEIALQLGDPQLQVRIARLQ